MSDLFTIRPHFADAEDVPRLTEQNTKMLAFLRIGPATNRQLMVIAMNYRARISELREWLQNNTGETIRCIRGKGGLNWYEIVKLTSGPRVSLSRENGQVAAPPSAACPGRSSTEIAT